MRKKVVSLFTVVMMGMALVACGEEKSAQETDAPTEIVEDPEMNGVASASTEITDESETAEEVMAQLDVEAKATKDGQAVVFITNNSHTVIDELEVELNYLNDAGETIDTYSDGHDMILPGYTVVSKMGMPTSDFADANEAVEINLDVHPSYENHSENVVVESNAGENGVIVEITNNDTVTIEEVEYDVVLFSGDDVVTICYPQDIYDLLPGQTTTEKVDVYNQKTYDSLVYGVDYDRIEVYLNQAHTFGF